MTAEERGMAMMYMPMKDLPPLALEFGQKLSNEGGMCAETLITAYTVYAQCVEGLPCTDDLYQAREVDIEWFNSKRIINHELQKSP